MKFGLKLWSTNTDLIDQAVALIDEKKFHYIELFVIPDTKIHHFIVDVPFVIHIPHHLFGVNIGDPERKEHNMQKIDESIRWADELKAESLILHAGSGSMEQASCILDKIEDERLLIENMPVIGPEGEKMIGYLPSQIMELTESNDFGLCLDFGHAVKASISLGFAYRKLICDFVKLEPYVFHISDGDLETEKDSHINFGEGSYDIKYFKECIENCKTKFITLETPRSNQLSLDEDLANINLLNKMWDL